MAYFGSSCFSYGDQSSGSSSGSGIGGSSGGSSGGSGSESRSGTTAGAGPSCSCVSDGSRTTASVTSGGSGAGYRGGGTVLKCFELADGFSSAEEETWGSEGEVRAKVQCWWRFVGILVSSYLHTQRIS